MLLSAIDFLPFSLPVLAHICVILLIAILLLIVRINLKLSSFFPRHTQHASSDPISATSVETVSNDRVPSRTPFEEFLNEDPNRRLLGKKEQSTAYRDWRSQKGLNWK
jgi:hypothetical protein